LRIYDLATFKLNNTIILGHESEFCYSAFEVNQTRFAITDLKNNVAIWDTTLLKEIYRFTVNGGRKMVHNSDLYVIDNYGKIDIWDINNMTNIKSIKVCDHCGTGGLDRISFLKGDFMIVNSITDSRTYEIWDLKSQKKVNEFDGTYFLKFVQTEEKGMIAASTFDNDYYISFYYGE